MAVKEYEPITSFDQWYENRREDPATGKLEWAHHAACALKFFKRYDYFKTEMDVRVKDYYKYEKQAAAEVVSEKAGLPNISSGDSAGFIERISKNVVQHTPNVEIVCEFDDDSIHGRMARYFLTHKIIGDDDYSNDMHQNLAASVDTALTIGFDCVIPVLQQTSNGSWYVQYDTIHYRDVFPEPGAKDIRRAHEVFVRRYLTKSDIHFLIKSQAAGWDVAALKKLLEWPASSREYVTKENEKHRVNPEAYEVITWYSDSGDPFLTWHPASKMLLRIEKNKHPLKEHPVFFLILKRDAQQPLGRSILSKTFGRQEFQDLYLNGTMKLLARNIDPPIFGFGTVNGMPNLSPGKYTQFSNPNAKVEAFEVNPQALMMFGSIQQQNQAQMSQVVGATDQQMAAQSTGGLMSQTPQGIEAQQQMVDVTTNQFQKAVEAFFSRYLSYALTIYFQELKGIEKFKPSASARAGLLDAGIEPEAFQEDGSLKLSLKDMATQYWVKVVPGTLVEQENERQVRLLNQMFVSLSQAMPALANTQNADLINNAAAAMQFIIEKLIELSGSDHSRQLKTLMTSGRTEEFTSLESRLDMLDQLLSGDLSDPAVSVEYSDSIILSLQEQMSLMRAGMQHLARLAGVNVAAPAPTGPALELSAAPSTPATPGPDSPQSGAPAATPTAPIGA